MTATETETAAQAFQIIPISALIESATNPRRHFDEKKLGELAENVKLHGVLVPLLVRPFYRRKLDAGELRRFEIVAGARRFRASQLAGVDTIPVRIVDLTDTEALEIQVIENLQREDVHPLEEAEGFRRLMDLDGYTVELLAEKVGRDESYIYKRLQLAKLIEPLKGKFLDGEITLAHAILLCRLSEKDQTDTAKKGLYSEQWVGGNKRERTVVTARALDRYIHEEIYLDLKSAPWDKTDVELLSKAGACNVCPKRSGANSQLFDDMPKGDVCLDSACFQAKRGAHLVQIEKKVIEAGETIVRVATEYLQPTEEKKLKAIGSNSYTRAEGKKKCGALEKALVVSGRGDVGKVIDICRDRSCKVHHPYGSSAGRGSAQLPFGEMWSAKKKRLDERIKVETRLETWRELVARGPKKAGRPELDVIASHMLDRAHHDRRRALCAALNIEPTKEKTKWSTHTNFEKPLRAHMKALSDSELVAFLVAFCFASSLESSPWGVSSVDLDTTAKKYGVDTAAIAKRVAAPLRAKFEKSKDSAKKKADEAKKAGKKKIAAKPKAAKAAPEPDDFGLEINDDELIDE